MSDAQVIQLKRDDGLDPRVVEELVELSDGTSWRKADRLVELFPVEEYGEADHGKNSGLYDEFNAYSDALRREHGIEWEPNRMRHQRATAIAWPDVERQTSTSYSVHEKIRGENRQAEMKKWLRQAEREGYPLTATMLGRYRTDEKNAEKVARGLPLLAPLDERAYKRFNSAAKGLLIGGGRIVDQEDWWNSRHASIGERQIVAEALRRLAEEIQP
jgi:hypothetical protein